MLIKKVHTDEMLKKIKNLTLKLKENKYLKLMQSLKYVKTQCKKK